MKIKKANIKDVKAIHSLVNKFAKKDDMLPRSLNEIYENLRDYVICAENEKVVAVAALHVLWEDLAEIRSVAVAGNYQRRGVGKKLIKYCLKDARNIGVNKVFALTYHPDYFKELGFEDIDKNDLPHKIWGDCLKCPKFPDCSEVAVIKRIEL
ncbi:MAG TPA: N-acetyltransferase [Nitrospirae bacterium]|nr:N-acetyltransferase [Nitrospirota bacterium]